MTPGIPLLFVTVPTQQLADDVGEVAGAEIAVWDMATPAPRPAIDIVVPPYMSMSAVLSRLDGVDVGIVQSQSIGYEGVADLLPAGKVFANASSVHETSTAELALALTLAAQRQLPGFVRAQESGTWAPVFADSLADRRVLLLGYGGVGKAVAARLAPFEVQLTAVASRDRVEDGLQVHGIDQLPALLPSAEIVIVTLPGGDATRHIIDDAALSALPDGALVVNVGRGPLIDTDALVAHARRGRIRAALDVTDPEPLPHDHPLWALPGVLIAPHVGGASSAMRPRIARLVRAQIEHMLRGEPPLNVVATGRAAPEWWRSAVIYQIYPRSFADANGDGIGDLPGVTSHLDDLADLGVDAVWLSPFQPSPQKDAGYDVSDYCDVDPLFGTLADFDAMLSAAHERGIRVIVDLVPNHSSDQHPWFQEALASPPGSPARARYMFRDGKGKRGERPPNNWESVFGGTAWTRVVEPDGRPGQWYLHIFDSSQPDFDWANPEVWAEFRRILRFWLDRGVDGFRVDVAHGLVKSDGLPDYTPVAVADSMGGREEEVPYWGQEGVHDVYRDWHKVLEEYDGDRALCGEAWMPSVYDTAKFVRADEMQQTFNFAYLQADWDAAAQREVIADSLDAFGAVGAPSTWVLSNHDVVRHATRLALTAENPQGHGIGPGSPGQPVPELGLRRARAATALMLALPGSAYLYQGEELGLPEVIDLPDAARQDPTWFRTGGERYGRDGCRVPLPWSAGAPAYGFNATGESWLPQPSQWSELARDAQAADAASTLSLYRALLAARRELALGNGDLVWDDSFGTDAVAFHRGDLRVVANLGEADLRLPEGAVVVASSEPIAGGAVPTDVTVWFRAG